MFDAAAQLFEQRHRAGDIGRSRLRQGRTACLLAQEPCFRRPDIRQRRAPCCRHRGADRYHRVRTHRAHVDHELAGELRLQNAVRAAVHRLGRRVVQQHHDDDLAALHEFRGRREQLCAGVDQRFCLRRIAIPDPDFVSDRHQSLCDRRSHSSSSAYADFHCLDLNWSGWFSLVSMKDAKILRDQFFIVQEIAGLAREHAASGVEDDRLIRNIERQLAVLFDQDDGLSFLLQTPDGAADLGDDQRRQAFRRFVEQQNPADCPSARVRSPASAVRRRRACRRIVRGARAAAETCS